MSGPANQENELKWGMMKKMPYFNPQTESFERQPTNCHPGLDRLHSR